jgi:fimbrial chaperone protein
MKAQRCCRVLPALLASMLAAVPLARAGEFSVNPLRVALDQRNKAAEVVIRNDDATPLRMQVQAMGWSQDDAGRDRYEPAEGLLYFPRVLEIPPGESRTVRVGVRAAPVTREEAYRLFLEEMPLPNAPAAASGASLRVFLRVGVAVFVGPASRSTAVETDEPGVQRGTVQWSVRNTGSVHVRADRFELAGYASDGTRLFGHEIPERYVLAGVTKTVRHDLGAETCARLVRVEATLQAEGVEARRSVDVAPRSCQ